MKPIVIETLAAIFGILGALLLSMKVEPAWGFAAFLVSNLGWMLFSLRLRAWRMFVQQVCFLVTSLIGLWNWWLGPLLLG